MKGSLRVDSTKVRISICHHIDRNGEAYWSVCVRPRPKFEGEDTRPMIVANDPSAKKALVVALQSAEGRLDGVYRN